MNIDAKALFLEILKCDTSNEVFDILKNMIFGILSIGESTEMLLTQQVQF